MCAVICCVAVICFVGVCVFCAWCYVVWAVMCCVGGDILFGR